MYLKSALGENKKVRKAWIGLCLPSETLQHGPLFNLNQFLYHCEGETSCDVSVSLDALGLSIFSNQFAKITIKVCYLRSNAKSNHKRLWQDIRCQSPVVHPLNILSHVCYLPTRSKVYRFDPLEVWGPSTFCDKSFPFQQQITANILRPKIYILSFILKK